MFILCSWWVLSSSQWDTPDTCSRTQRRVYSAPQREETVDLGSVQTQENSMNTHTPAYCDQQLLDFMVVEHKAYFRAC